MLCQLGEVLITVETRGCSSARRDFRKLSEHRSRFETSYRNKGTVFPLPSFGPSSRNRVKGLS